MICLGMFLVARRPPSNFQATYLRTENCFVDFSVEVRIARSKHSFALTYFCQIFKTSIGGLTLFRTVETRSVVLIFCYIPPENRELGA